MYPTDIRNPGPAKASILRKTPGPRGTSSVACTPGRLGSAGKLRQAAGSVAMTSYFIGDVGFRHCSRQQTMKSEPQRAQRSHKGKRTKQNRGVYLSRPSLWSTSSEWL